MAPETSFEHSAAGVALVLLLVPANSRARVSSALEFNRSERRLPGSGPRRASQSTDRGAAADRRCGTPVDSLLGLCVPGQSGGFCNIFEKSFLAPRVRSHPLRTLVRMDFTGADEIMGDLRRMNLASAAAPSVLGALTGVQRLR